MCYENFPINWNELMDKKIAHIWRRWATPQNLYLAFIDELEKQLFIEKTVEVGQ